MMKWIPLIDQMKSRCRKVDKKLIKFLKDKSNEKLLE